MTAPEAAVAPLRVGLVDDAVLFRDLLAAMLAERLPAEVRTYGDAATLLTELAQDPVDLAVLDIRLPPSFRLEGLDAAVRIRAEHPGVGVLLLSQHLEGVHLHKLLRPGTGGFGYLLKERVSSISAFVDSVRRVAAGGTVVDPEIVEAGLARRHSRLDRLSPREHEVLRLMAEGRSNQAICDDLGLSTKTLETHIRGIFHRLDLVAEADANRRVLAVVAYLRSADSRG